MSERIYSNLRWICCSSSFWRVILLFFFFCPLQGVPGTPAPVHRPAAGSGCGCSQLKPFRRSVVCMWMSVRGVNTVFVFFFVMFKSGCSSFFYFLCACNYLKIKWNSAAWLDCRASCRARPVQSRETSRLWWWYVFKNTQKRHYLNLTWKSKYLIKDVYLCYAWIVLWRWRDPSIISVLFL